MARFKYLGEKLRPGLVKVYGPCTQINVPKKDGTSSHFTPVPPSTQFVIGEDIGYDVTDSRSIRYMQVDTRFEQIAP